jgi:hypothetical protein
VGLSDAVHKVQPKRPLFGYWSGGKHGKIYALVPAALRVCWNGLRFWVNADAEALQRQAAVVEGASRRAREIDRVSKLVVERYVCLACAVISTSCAERARAAAVVLKIVERAADLARDAMSDRAQADARRNGGVLQKWTHRFEAVAAVELAALDGDDELLTYLLDGRRKRAPSKQQAAAAVAPVAAEQTIEEESRPPPPPPPPPPLPLEPGQVFTVTTSVKSLKDAIQPLLGKSRVCVSLNHSILKHDAADIGVARWRDLGFVPTEPSKANGETTLKCTYATIDYIRTNCNLPPGTSIVFIDPGAAGGFVMVSDDGRQLFVLNIDKFSRRNLIDSDRGHLRDGVDPRQRANLDRYHAAVLDVLSRRRISTRTHTIVVLGRNWTHGWHNIVFDLLQRGVGVLLYEETGTSRNCANCCTGLLTGADEKMAKMVCTDFIENRKQQLAKADDARKARLAEKKDQAKPPPKPPPEELFPPIEASLGVSCGRMASAKVADNGAKWAAVAALAAAAAAGAAEEDTDEVEAKPAVRGCGLTRKELDGARELGVRRQQQKQQQQQPVQQQQNDTDRHLRKSTVWKSSWSSVELEKLRLRLTEFHGLSRRERFLMVLAVGTGHCKDESEAHRLAKAGALESMPLTTSHNNRGVLDKLTRFVADERVAGSQPRHVPNAFGMVDALATVRGRQFQRAASTMSNSQLERKVQRLIERARCDNCINSHERCNKCLEQRLAVTRRPACAGQGLCDCGDSTKISAAKFRAVDHSVKSWRQRKCKQCSVQVHRDFNAVRAEAAGCASDIVTDGRRVHWQCRSGSATDKRNNETNNNTHERSLLSGVPPGASFNFE